jgi:predicted nucleic acid-binding Zn ribbon protein
MTAPIARASWREAVGPTLARFSKPTELNRGVLTVRCKNSIFRNELFRWRKEIAARVGSLCNVFVCEVRVTGKQMAPWEETP